MQDLIIANIGKYVKEMRFKVKLSNLMKQDVFRAGN